MGHLITQRQTVGLWGRAVPSQIWGWGTFSDPYDCPRDKPFIQCSVAGPGCSFSPEASDSYWARQISDPDRPKGQKLKAPEQVATTALGQSSLCREGSPEPESTPEPCSPPFSTLFQSPYPQNPSFHDVCLRLKAVVRARRKLVVLETASSNLEQCF